MPAIEIGRICIKTVGREAGQKCIVVDLIDKNFVLITGPKKVTGIKRRRSNVNHVKPTEYVIDIDRGASDADVEKALKAAGKNKEMKEKAHLVG